MTLIYEDEDGEVFVGETPSDVVRSMAAAKLTKPKDRKHYRRAVARRVQSMSGLRIETKSDNLFLLSLVDNGLLTVRH